MAIYRQVQISFWQDSFVLNLTPEEKFFYLYLLTNSKTNQIGIYELPKKVMCFETGYNDETIDKLLNRFIDYGKVKYCEETKEVFIINWIKHNLNSSPKVLAKAAKDLEEVKCSDFTSEYLDLCILYGYGIDTVGILNPNNNNKNNNKNNNNNKNKTSSSRQKSDEATKIPYDEIVDLYHSICKSLPRIRALTEARKAQIRARWNENPDLEFWREFFERVENSDFLTGKVDRHDERKPFIADLQWITKQENQLKILEGKYDNREEVIDADKRRIIENIRRLKQQQDAERTGGSDRNNETE